MIDHWLREIKDAFIAIFRPILKIDMSPNVLTLLSGAFGLFSCYLCAFDLTFWAFFFWNMNRLFDGLDGYYARQKGMTSDFGGYLDIVVDFTVYALIPLGICYSRNDSGVFAAAVFMEGTFFVNAASLFFLSALIEKNEHAKQAYAKSERTTLKMPPALIEGFETQVAFSLFILFPLYAEAFFWVFGWLVAFNIVQRMWWAYYNLEG